MNIFYINRRPKDIAHDMCDEHILKMGVETAQMLSTAHRVLDGEPYTEITNKNGNARKMKRWRLNDDREYVLYKASHINHPQNIWLRSNNSNYMWSYELFMEIMEEFTYRYDNPNHKSMNLMCHLDSPPNNIHKGTFYEPPLTMDDIYKSNDTIGSYRRFYIHGKQFATWNRKRAKPEWMNNVY